MPQVGSSSSHPSGPLGPPDARKAVAALQPAVVRLISTGPQQQPNADDITEVLKSFDQKALHYAFELAYVPLVAMLKQSYRTLPENSTISLVEALAYLLDKLDPAIFPTVTTAVLFPIADFHTSHSPMAEELARALARLAGALIKYRSYSPLASRNSYHVGYTLHLLLNPLRINGDKEGQVVCFNAISNIAEELASDDQVRQWYPGIVSTISTDVVMDPHASKAVLSAALDCWRKWMSICIEPDTAEGSAPSDDITGTAVALGKVISRFGTSSPLPVIPNFRLLLTALERMPASWGQVADALDILVASVAMEKDLASEAQRSPRYITEVKRYATSRTVGAIGKGDWSVVEGYVTVAYSCLDVRAVWEHLISVVKPEAFSVKDVLSERQPLHPGESGSPIPAQQSIDSLWAEVDRISDQSLGTTWIGSLLPTLAELCELLVDESDLTAPCALADPGRISPGGFYLWLSLLPSSFWRAPQLIELLVGRIEEDSQGWSMSSLSDRLDMYMMLRAVSRAAAAAHEATTPILTRLLCRPLLSCLGSEYPYIRSAASLAMLCLAATTGVGSVGGLIYDNADRIVDQVVFILRHSSSPSSSAPLVLALTRYSADSTEEMSFWLSDIVKELVRVKTTDEAWVLECLSAVLWVIFKAQAPSSSGTALSDAPTVPPLEVLFLALRDDSTASPIWQPSGSHCGALTATALSDEELSRPLTPSEWMAKVALERVTPVLTASDARLLTPALWCVSRALPLLPEPARPAALVDCWASLKAAAMQPGRSKPQCLLAVLDLLSNVLLTSIELAIFMRDRVWSDLWPAMSKVHQRAQQPHHSVHARLQLAVCNSLADLCGAIAVTPDVAPNSDATLKDLVLYLLSGLDIPGERGGLVRLALTKLGTQEFDLVMSQPELPDDIRKEIIR
ncbi:hypothetical protein FOL47_010932 [Perkinsus chesapeaki]|uniref:TTI1 N-terminal TPR domain-containing protein n=1 Tax=Perkinsus chesapeaki TaxID=330153 RepID=A0A7J6N439_PERCH|nr:hypothetical protein FOL47_010932 [Perkinsus chesapeaki]